MLAEQFGPLIKAQRKAKGLRQEDLAAAAKVSRTVLSRLERGSPGPVQTDVVDRIMEALGIKLHVSDLPPSAVLRKQARLEQQIKLNEQRERHLRLAARLAVGGQEPEQMIAKARERVDLWREKKSCSASYIDRWSQLLSLSPQKLAMAMLGLGAWEAALFQNSPWSWAWS